MMPAVIFLIVEVDFLFSRSIEQGLPCLLGKVLEGGIDIDAIVPAQGIKHLLEIDGMPVGPGLNSAFPEGQTRIGDDEIGVEIPLGAETAAIRAGPLGVIEREHLGSEIRHADPALITSRLLAEKELLEAHNIKEGLSFGQIEGEFHGIGETASDVFVND